jgi:hypothetical protein
VGTGGAAPPSQLRRPSRSARRFLRAAAVAGVLSGAPSTVHAVVTKRDVLSSTRAAGTLLGRPTVARGLLAHTAITLGWTAVIAAAPLARRRVVAGAAAGLLIGALDLGVARRRFPAISALPTVPQLLDHAAFGALVVATLGRR